MSRTAIDVRRLRAVILAVVALSAVLLGVAAMHASTVQHDPAGAPQQATMTVPMTTAAVGERMDAGASSDRAMGDMNLADCLILGMLCFLTAAALIVWSLLIARLRGLLRPRAAARSLGRALRGLRPPEPPSLLALSISRT